MVQFIRDGLCQKVPAARPALEFSERYGWQVGSFVDL